MCIGGSGHEKQEEEMMEAATKKMGKEKTGRRESHKPFEMCFHPPTTPPTSRTSIRKSVSDWLRRRFTANEELGRI